MVPSSFTRISHVPLTLNGKLNLSALPEPESPREGDHKHREPENEKQRRLCHLWQQEMGITRVGIDDDFFHLGGNSMTAIKLIHRINQELDSNLSLKTIYSHRTVRALSLLENAQTTTSHVIAEALDPAIVPAVPKPDATLPSILPDTDASPLITGAAGFVGRYLLHEQLIHSSRPVYCLLRGSSEVSAYKHLRSKLVENRLWCDHFERRIRVVLGSIDKPKLGMAEEDYAHICESTNVIYHCATYMNHLADYTEMKAANVDSIGEVLSLAATARPKRVVYLSTTGVFNDQEGRRVEEQTDISKEVHTCDNGYLATKWAAEMQMLEAQRRGFDVSIVRLGLTSGATSGHCDQKQWLTQLLHTVNELGCCFNEAFIDASILPVDYVAKAIWTISHQNEMAPIYHLANNNSSSFSELMLEYNKVSRLPIEQVSYPEFIRRLYAHQRQGGKIAAAHLFADDLNALAKNGQPPSTPCTSNETKVSSTNTITYLNRLGFTKPDIDGQLIEKYMHFVSGIRRILSL
ncbi:hypothetical protein AT251_17880 [Enterovibrio nigricans]|nr:hypothetical protein AT251_17880 [Enterovibrio nigricans]